MGHPTLTLTYPILDFDPALSLSLSNHLDQVAMSEVSQWGNANWSDELTDFDTDVLQDASINNLVYTKVKDVFAALVDAAVLAGSAIVVDRTAGMGSATAEVKSNHTAIT